MSINGINNPLLSSLGPVSRPATERANGTATNTGAAHTATHGIAGAPTLRPQQPIAGPSSSQQAVPAEAPAGTDPALWNVLTTEERAFFAKTAALGPLTYGRLKAATQPTAPAPRGVRLDVRA